MGPVVGDVVGPRVGDGVVTVVHAKEMIQNEKSDSHFAI